MGLSLRRHAGPLVVLLATVLVLALVVASAAGAAGLSVRGSVEQVQVTGAAKGAKLTLVTRKGKKVETQKAGPLGGVVFRQVTPAKGYVVRTAAGKRSRAVTVLSQRSAPPTTKTYKQKIPSSGYGYLTTRDGTRLAIDVHLPTAGGKGPFPTLIEYAGYGYANPAGGESSIAQVAELLGFAVVDVNMRGTGCSGGAFDYFEPLQGLDGYDVIETVARQPWVLHNKVGMMGISYGGISQLFVGATRPPSLAAIAPLSVIDNTQTTLYPGGILNTGFALSWAKDRVHDAKAASKTGGQAWALKRIAGGDATCKSNQDLHPQAVDLLKKTAANDHYVPKVADPLSPITFVHKIDVPTFLACQFTDEQTGGHCPALADHFTGTSKKWFTFTNGTHIDSLDPATFTRWYDFLELYVARQAPKLSDATKALAPTVFSAAMGVQGLTLPDDPIQAQPTLAAAQSAFEALPQVRVEFDNGAGGPAAFAPGPGFEQSFAKFPLPGTRAQSWYLGDAGALTDAPAAADSTSAFTWSRTSRPATSFTGNTDGGTNGLWTTTPSYNWTTPAAGAVATWTTAPLTANTVVVGAGKVEAFVKASTPDVDLQATVTELRPDGSETFVQSGWLRASMRKLDATKSTDLAPVLSLRAADQSNLPAAGAMLTIPLYYEGHAYRAGSRIRVTLGPPRGDQPVWAFANTVPKTGTSNVTVSAGPAHVSRLVLPVVDGIDVPTALPACPSLRGEPCRVAAAG
ncbi:MAG: peptidase [Conexibacter sp.]|nr:peptidase [Conexibacter sp.]